jgi:small subunit ribosomal protein S20
VPRIKSAKKAMRQGRARQGRNRAQNSALRTALKRVRSATTREQAGEAYRLAARLLDRAARKHLIHSNTAARHKSRLAAVVGRLTKA